MEFEKLDDIVLSDDARVKVTEMGNVTELMYMSHKNYKATVQKLNKNEFIVLSTGEKKEFVHTANRSEGKKALRITLRKLRNLLNANIVDVENCRWITLTYAENMRDTVKLYFDFDKFNKRLKYYFSKLNLSYEYIVAMEPQGRGAWHCHLVLIFDTIAPYIPNDVLADIWGNGFVTVKRLDDVDNVGAYLTAYLGDMDLDEAIKTHGLGIIQQHEAKEVLYTDEKGMQQSKYYIKGARLNLYPPGFNLYRCSRGIKKPIEYEEKNIHATKKASAGTLTYRSTHQITTDDGFNTIIDKRYYNKKRVDSQSVIQCTHDYSDYDEYKMTFADEMKYTHNILGIDKRGVFLNNYDDETGEIFSTPFDESGVR